MSDHQLRPYRRKEMDDMMNTVKDAADNLAVRGQSTLDHVFPPENRAQVWSRLQAFASHRPKLAAFLIAQLVMSGIPVILFLTFTIATLIFSLVVGLLIGLLGALVFTAFAVGFALFFVVPTLFITTMAATFISFWGVVGFYVLRWLNSGEAASQGKAISAKLNKITEGRMPSSRNDSTKAIEGKQPGRNSNDQRSSGADDKMKLKKPEVKKEEPGTVSPEDPANGFTVLAEPVEEPFDQLDLGRMKRMSDSAPEDKSVSLGEAKG